MKKALLTFVITGMAISGCTRKQLLEAPNPELDPFLKKNKVSSTEEAQGDPKAKDQWALDKIRATQVFEKSQLTGSRRMRVAVLSTGIDYNHEDLKANVWRNVKEMKAVREDTPRRGNNQDDDGNGYVDDFLGYDFVNEDGLPYDHNGLGTAAAGLIGAVHENGRGVQGVLPKVNLVPVKYIKDDGRSSVHLLVQALQYSLDVQADLVFLHLANLNYEKKNPEKGALKKALNKLQSENVPLVVSAGRSGGDPRKTSDVAKTVTESDGSFVVTSVNKQDQRPFIANYSMEVVDTAAPGENVLTTKPQDEYERVSGTYAAAALAAGSMGLALNEHYDRYDVTEFYQAFLSAEGSDPVPGLKFETVGGNRLNLARLMRSLN